MGSESGAVTYVGKNRTLQGTTYHACCDYEFQFEQSNQSQRMCIGITEGWHDRIQSLGRTLTEDELVAIAKEFLERELAKGSIPVAGKNRLEIPYGAMEYRVQNGSFPN